MKNEEIKNLIKDLVEKVGVSTNNISVIENDGTNTWFAVEVNEPHFFINHDGEALHALNHLVRRILENKFPNNLDVEDSHKSDLWGRIMIDVNDFQKKRMDSIRAIAHMMGERARYFKSSVEVDPMSSFDRRVVHEFLSNATDLKTESTGFGPTRRVVIKYIGTI
jgi:spoIIIJ-associated protein